VDTFENIVRPLLAEKPITDLDKTVYGLRVMLCREDGNERRTALLPWISYDFSRAERMRQRLLHTPDGAVKLSLFALVFHTEDDNLGNFTAEAIRIVRLAEIPF
jgi:hypothetical protein